MDDYRIRVAKALEMARAESGLSQQKLADKMGVGRTSIFRYEQGTMTPRCFYYHKVVCVLRCCGQAVHRHLFASRIIGESGWQCQHREKERYADRTYQRRPSARN